MKWSLVPKESAKPKYVLLNGDESEPGTCKDRLILEQDPHSVIEGVVIAGLAVGAQTGYIYIRGEYRYLGDIMRKALADAYARGFLGKNILGSGREFNAYWHTGAGAYEVGEESALMASLAGRRGIPPMRPPFPAGVGVVGCHDSTCRVKFALRRMKFYRHESCGSWIPCREGTDWLAETLVRFSCGGGIKKDIDNIR